MSLNIADIKRVGGTVSKKKDYGRLPDGTHSARIVSVIDMGLQEQTHWQTRTNKGPDGVALDPKRIVMITFETPDEMLTYTDKEDNEVTKPRWMSKEYTLSFHEMAALRKLVNAIKPDIESLDELLNLPCNITIGSTNTGNAKITAVSNVKKNEVIGELQNDSFHFDFSNPDMDLFNGLLKWQQDKIKEALDYDGFADSFAKTGTNDVPF